MLDVQTFVGLSKDLSAGLCIGLGAIGAALGEGYTAGFANKAISQRPEKGGDIAYYLNGLYAYQLELLAKANLENETKYLDDVIRVLKGLIEAWKEETGIS